MEAPEIYKPEIGYFVGQWQVVATRTLFQSFHLGRRYGERRVQLCAEGIELIGKSLLIARHVNLDGEMCLEVSNKNVETFARSYGHKLRKILTGLNIDKLNNFLSSYRWSLEDEEYLDGWELIDRLEKSYSSFKYPSIEDHLSIPSKKGEFHWCLRFSSAFNELSQAIYRIIIFQTASELKTDLILYPPPMAEIKDWKRFLNLYILSGRRQIGEVSDEFYILRQDELKHVEA